MYGFKDPVQDERDYTLGAVSKIINPSGQWLAYTPLGEEQRKEVETANCTGFTLANCLEILERFHFQNSVNYSDRFVGVNAGTYPPGNNPKTVMNKARKAGMINEEKLPFVNIKTLSEYYASISNSLKKQGLKWLTTRSISYELIFAPWMKVNKKEVIKKALKRGPLSVSVRAWNKNNNGLYTKTKGATDNHNCVMVDELDTHYLIFDSYPDGTSYLKKLEPNYDFQFGWVIILEDKPYKPNWFGKLIDWLMNFLG